MNNKVWYASYGSNLLWERFRYYIEGGTFPGNGREYDGCEDTELPAETRRIEIPFERYYARNSSSWSDGGVAFIDPEKPGKTMGRMYLITEGQFAEVKDQEGPDWYGREVCLGKYDGCPVMTFTEYERSPETEPSEGYLAVVREGEEETKGIEAVRLVPADGEGK